MSYSQKLRDLFPGLSLVSDDMLLLETFQIGYLPDRVPMKEFSTLIRTYPVIQRFLISKYPPIEPFIRRILSENKDTGDKDLAEKQCQEALWEIADLIIYNKHPELLDTHGRINWDLEEINSICSLEGKVVADVGAGSGRIAFLVAAEARTVYAIEPITSFRSYMKEKAREKKACNLFVMDGTLDSIPVAAHSFDVLITSNAIGWNLLAELQEVERVVRKGGQAIHLIHADSDQDNPFHETLTSTPWNYSCLQKREEERIKTRYFKEI